ncbi:hypothetical protein HOLleu_14170 [Holothuria leucospilota]|uniref:Sulfotransferase family protein n=1 Tax=Holothuria leucospilota TaxID=206669 RepID=A0A9Q1HC93_HOLLE|nr:hypothetical protein HOLleu_14170 [Holothuria leucospilota]
MNPRSLSTVFVKCISFMEGAVMWNEPYGSTHYGELMFHPETVELYPKLAKLNTQVVETCKYYHYFDGGNLRPASAFSYEWVQAEPSKPLPAGKKFLFVKDGAKSITGRFDKLPKVPFKHTFIIRDPLRSANSVRRLFMEFFQYDGDPKDFNMYESNPLLDTKILPPNPCHDVWKYVKENVDPNPVVIDADDLQNFPEQILKKYCEAVDIPFHAKYLQWDESDKSMRNFNACLEQMVLGKELPHHEAAFSSSCFKPIKTAKPRIEDLTPDGQRYVLENRDGYNEMYDCRLKPEL